MVPRLPHLVVEIGRFMVTGGLSTLTSFIIFNFLAHGLYLTSDPWMASHPITAFLIATICGMLVSYRLSRYWTFRHRPPVHADGGRTAFFVINVVTMPLSIGCLWFSRHVLHLTDVEDVRRDILHLTDLIVKAFGTDEAIAEQATYMARRP